MVSGYSNILISLEDGNQNALFHSPGALDLRQYITSATLDKNARQGNVYLFSGPALTTKAHSVTHNDQTNWRMSRLPVGQLPDGKPAYTLYMALSIDFHLHYINDLKNKLIMTALLISMMIIFIVLFAVHKGHEPIRTVSRRIQNITSKDLDVRLEPQAVPIELEQLVSSFNHMIERIEDVFTRQSNFSADIAHEIRTPLRIWLRKPKLRLASRVARKSWRMCSILISKSSAGCQKW